MDKLKLERKKNAVSNIVWGYTYRIVTVILPFVFRKVVITNMGSEYLGLNSLFVSILNVLNMTELGFGSVIVVYMYKPVAERNNEELCRILNFYHKVYRLLGTVILLAGIAIVPFLKIFFNVDYPKDINIYIVYLIFLGDTVVSYFFFAYRISLFSAYQNNDIISKVMAVTTFFRYIYAIVIVVLFQNYYLYVIILPITTIISNLICYVLSIKYFPQIKCRGNVSREFINSVRHDIGGLMCHKISGTLTFSADTVIISRFLGLVTLAKYTNYATIMDSLFAIILIFFDSTIAGIGNSYQTETLEKNNRDYNKMFFINFWIASWCSICLLCLFQDFINFWVGKDMVFEIFTVILMCLYFYLRIIRKTLHTYANALGLWRVNAAQPIVSTIFNIALNLILVKKIGLNGVIISTILSFAIVDIPWETVVVYKKISGLSVINYVIVWLIYFLEFIFGSAVTYWLCSYVKTDIQLLNLLFKGIICVIIPNALFAITNCKNKNFRDSVNLIRGMIQERG